MDKAQELKQEAAKKLVSESLKTLDAAHKTMNEQADTIDSAIRLRMFNSHIIEILKAINTNNKLSPTIENLERLCKEFDLLARDNSRYKRLDYMQKTAEVEEAAKATYRVPVPYNVRKSK